MPNTNDTVSLCVVSVDGPEIGSRELERVQDLDETDDTSKEVLKAMGRKHGVGMKRVGGGGGFSMNVYEEKGAVPEVDWHRAKDDDWQFTMTLDNVGGTKNQYLGCEVANVAASKDAEGGNMLKVEIVWLKREKLRKSAL